MNDFEQALNAMIEQNKYVESPKIRETRLEASSKLISELKNIHIESGEKAVRQALKSTIITNKVPYLIIGELFDGNNGISTSDGEGNTLWNKWLDAERIMTRNFLAENIDKIPFQILIRFFATNCAEDPTHIDEFLETLRSY